MVDPRLNSIHLDPPRREEYRRARHGLLNARGWHTLAAENHDETDHPADNSPHTLLQNADQLPGDQICFWLQDREFVYPLKVGLNTVGRSQDNDVVVEDAYISRRHCAILVHASQVVELHDTASKNGTYLNGQRLSGPTRLNPGDEIRICDRLLLYQTKNDDRKAPDPSVTMSE